VHRRRANSPQNLSPTFGMLGLGVANFTLFQRVSRRPGHGDVIEALPFTVVLYALRSDNKNRRFAAVFKPSPGLEPRTASLPWRLRPPAM
jgi:hypothetical protein